MTDYLADVKKYDAAADEAIVGKIVKHLGIALRNRDSSLVSASDPEELARVKASLVRQEARRYRRCGRSGDRCRRQGHGRRPLQVARDFLLPGRQGTG